MTSKRIGVARGKFTVPDEAPLTADPAGVLDLHDPLTLQALLEIIEVLRSVTLGARMQFFLNPRGSLGGMTPLQALERPELRAQVLAAAHSFAEL